MTFPAERVSTSCKPQQKKEKALFARAFSSGAFRLEVYRRCRYFFFAGAFFFAFAAGFFIIGFFAAVFFFAVAIETS